MNTWLAKAHDVIVERVEKRLAATGARRAREATRAGASERSRSDDIFITNKSHNEIDPRVVK